MILGVVGRDWAATLYTVQYGVHYGVQYRQYSVHHCVQYGGVQYGIQYGDYLVLLWNLNDTLSMAFLLQNQIELFRCFLISSDISSTRRSFIINTLVCFVIMMQ